MIKRGTRVQRVSGLTAEERLAFYSIPEPNSGCLLWLGSMDTRGYGQLRYDGRLQFAHRLAWSIANGDIPKGHSVLHKCDNPSCVNPIHLFVGTQKDNIADMVAKGRQDHSGLALGRKGCTNQVRGEACARSKLTDEQVLAIRADKRGSRRLALAYGITPSTIKAIRARRTWRHI